MIFAAGLGTRLKPLTDTMPKALLPIAGKTLLQWQIEKLHNAGIREIVVNVHHFADQIIDYLHANENFGCQIAVSDERGQLLETGGGLYKAADLLCDGSNAPVLACNVDILSNIRIEDLEKSYRSDMLGLLVVSRRQTQRYLLFDIGLRLHGWTNIATGELRPAGLADAGTFQRLAFSGMQMLSHAIFENMENTIAQKGCKFSLIDLYLNLCATQPLYGYIPAGYQMMDVGKIDQLATAESFAATL